jgi:hypothetical protein
MYADDVEHSGELLERSESLFISFAYPEVMPRLEVLLNGPEMGSYGPRKKGPTEVSRLEISCECVRCRGVCEARPELIVCPADSGRLIRST